MLVQLGVVKDENANSRWMNDRRRGESRMMRLGSSFHLPLMFPRSALRYFTAIVARQQRRRERRRPGGLCSVENEIFRNEARSVSRVCNARRTRSKFSRDASTRNNRPLCMGRPPAARAFIELQLIKRRESSNDFNACGIGFHRAS